MLQYKTHALGPLPVHLGPTTVCIQQNVKEKLFKTVSPQEESCQTIRDQITSVTQIYKDLYQFLFFHLYLSDV